MARILVAFVFVLCFLAPTQVVGQGQTLTLPRAVSVYPVMSATAAPVAALARGVIVTVVARQGDWLLVQYSGGRQGYLRAADTGISSVGNESKGPCADSLYQELKKKDLNAMTEREWVYFQERDRACAAYQQTQTPVGQAATPTLAVHQPFEPGPPQFGNATHARRGFWFNGGLGWGSIGCLDCNERVGGLSGGLAFGGTISPRVLFGVASNGWTKTESGVTLTAGSLTAAMRFYTSRNAGFFFLAGLGVGQVDLTISGYGSGSGVGYAALLGLGYDVRVGPMTSLTPFWNGIGISNGDGEINFGQIGLGITVH